MAVYPSTTLSGRLHLLLGIGAAMFALSACGSSSQTITSPPAARCAVQAQADRTSFTDAGGSGTLQVTTNRECTWSAQSVAPWVKLVAPTTGQGDGTLKFSVDANADPPVRSGAINVNDVKIELSQAGRPCRVGVSSEHELVAAAGGDRTIQVTASSGQCSWTASSAVPWITIVAGARGNGNGSVTFHVAAAAGPSRAGTITIAGHVVQIEQGTGCTFSTSDRALGFGSSGGSAPVRVETAPGCVWTALAGEPWISITGSQASGSGQALLTVAPNTGPARQGSAIVAGQTVAISQESGCTYTVTADSHTLPPVAATRSVSLTTGGGCAWTATSSASWIRLSPGSGTGSATVQVSASSNVSIPRRATLTIAGRAIEVVQESACTFVLSPPSMVHDANGGNGAVLVIVSGSCTWEARSEENWITMVSGTSQAGSGLVQFVVAHNPGAERTGVVVIAGQRFEVRQGGR